MIKNFMKVALVLMISLLFACDGVNTLNSNKVMSKDDAAKELNGLLDGINWTQNFNKRRANIDLTAANLMSTLPDISEYSLVVNPSKSSANEIVEIFVSSEKSGKGTDGWMNEAANKFNSQNNKLNNGKIAKVAIRKIASGTASQFIASGKAIPDAYSPSNRLWVDMVEANGVNVNLIMDKTVGNVAGIVLKKSSLDKLKQQYQSLDVPEIIDAVIQGQLVMGYTNPYSSSTGLNFLITVLNVFSGSTGSDMLRPDVVSTFEGFQGGVPYVAMSTMQMRDSVRESGALDAFVMEYQTFIAAKPSMTSEYAFIPFGIRHDNPLYAIGDLSASKQEVLSKFSELLKSSEMAAKATSFGFNSMPKYQSAYNAPEGSILLKAQKIWKEKKSAGQKTVAIFLADVSGSMAGSRIKGLRDSLKAGSNFISKDNHIGLVSFSNEVNVELAPAEFTLIQKSAFYAAAEDLNDGGTTAIYDGVIVSLSLLLDAKKSNPDAKLMLFVLSDGEATAGHSLTDIKEIVSALGIPIYTISYGQLVPELKELSSLVESTTISASESNAGYAIGNLLNAQM